MKPTCKFRYTQRTVSENQGHPCIWFPNIGTVWVLQQWWIEERHPDINWLTPPNGEWRDITIEEEMKK